MKRRKIITICSSASFYKHVLAIEKELKKLGFAIHVPITAKRMEKANNFVVKEWKTWFTNSDDYTKKALLMRGHFQKVAKADAILVVNLQKNWRRGYIGANVLMEMALAFHLKKKIFLYDAIDDASPFLEEIKGVLPVVLHREIKQLKVLV